MVKSNCINTNEFEFYITEFLQFGKFFWTATNKNIYNLIITYESIDDLLNFITELNFREKNPKFDFFNFIIFNYDTDEQYDFLNELGFKTIKKININFTSYEPNIVEKPEWAFDNHVLYNNYYIDDNIKIIFIDGIDNHWHIIEYLNNNMYIFVKWPCFFCSWNYQFARNVIFTKNKNNINLKNIIYQCPNLDGILWAIEYGFDYIFCNHNCWLDYNLFKILDDEDKNYDLVINCRPENNFKRPYLASKVNNIAFIKGYLYNKNDFYDYTQLNCKYINESIIDIDEIVKIYNQSYCGGIFSEKEGACNSSSEYLLCGLPVISTRNKGGRDIWYNKYNSIIVEPDEYAVLDAVNYFTTNCIIDKEKIRNEHIKLSDEMRNIFNEKIQEIFNLNNINICALEYFNNNFFHKMTLNMELDQYINFLINSK